MENCSAETLYADYIQLAHHGQDGVNEEFYKYVLAFDTAQQAEYSGFPSSTPFMSYNNIEGGSGIFAGVSVYDSGMFTVE